jgi:hypothetical protein
MLVYVETGVQFTNDYGDIGDGFYSCLEKTYVQALEILSKEDINQRKVRNQESRSIIHFFI